MTPTTPVPGSTSGDDPRPGALVTGGARGIGAACAAVLAELGYRVAIHYRSNAQLAKATRNRIDGEGHITIAGDLSRPDEARGVVEQAVAQLGTIDVLVNNVGIYESHPIDSTDFESWQQAWAAVVSTNLIATANTTWSFVQHLLTRDDGPAGGRIVCIGSRGAYRGEPDAPAYGATKAGVHAFAQSLAVSLAKHEIGVFALAPGVIATELTADLVNGELGESIRAQSPFGRVGAVQEVASVLRWLVSADSIWSSGAVLDFNGASYLR
ncbi:SDR family NAD(P)-dependent oxidoreductase [Streptomyces hokutonensis]|uniref:SDR family NAD(P)-dependent oxidoreductase n=1 Tax=Streptomyces hokutonensis TaxID=1306990 RepID=UPI003826BB8E